MAILSLDGDNSGAIRALAETSEALDRLTRKAAATKIAPDGAKVRSLEGDVRSLEAAGRLLGGRFGEVTGALGDFSDMAESGSLTLGATSLAMAAVAAAAVGTVAGMVRLTQSAIDVANETDAMNAELRDAEVALATVNRETESLILSMGTRAAPAVASMSFALAGLIDVAEDTADAVGEQTPDGLGTLLLAQAAVTYPMTTAAVMSLAQAYGYLEERGRGAAQEQAKAAKELTEGGLLKALGMESATSAASRIRDQQAQEARRAADQAEADAQRRAEQARQQREREVAEQNAAAQAAHDFALRLERERAAETAELIQGAQGLRFQSLSETMAAEDAANREQAAQAAQAAQIVAQQWEQSYAIQRDSAFGAVNAAIGLLSDLVGENREAAIAMFAVRQAAAIAETVVSTQVAAARAVAELGPIAGPPAAVAIQAAGAVSVGVIAAQSVLEGVQTFGGGRRTQAAANQTFNLVVDGNALRGAVRPYGGSARFGQRA